ncbi:hypothetical protein CLUG_00397 [Clavispora lusitaniae ATCC 42720]|uniref:Uncharacterized protein n=1 Tax=Clavispora lusitaniae (strain ATCC 42720) TaxID=306902 RepID=C4XWS4_CLAL4|nr:uncharacterized protein CLUG_00397 [Clavispora lusitaniae ATCC 42720]EEQ36275.1 hypothetical protein CLUG_00397 [Clavispora lusitaniae ATCC 42720]
MACTSVNLRGVTLLHPYSEKKDWNAQVLVLRSDVQVARSLEGQGTAPFVHVDTEKVCSFVFVSASKVVGQVDTDVHVIVGRITHRNGSVALLLDVCLGVSDGSLDVGRGIGVGNLIGDFISGEETQDIGVVVELVDDRGVTFEQSDVPLRVQTVDRQVWLGQVGNDVDSGVGQSVHTFGVVKRSVQRVDTDHVGLQLLQVRNITLTCLWVAQRINKSFIGGGISRIRSVGHTPHQKSQAVVGVEKLVAHDFNRRQVGNSTRHKGRGKQRLEQHWENGEKIVFLAVGVYLWD